MLCVMVGGKSIELVLEYLIRRQFCLGNLVSAVKGQSSASLWLGKNVLKDLD